MLLIQYWHTEEIPDYIANWSASFRRHNPGLDHRIFNHASAEAFITKNFGPREVAAFRACAVPSMQANYLRYCAVLTLGGIYSDADFRCVGALNSLQDGTEGGTLFIRRDRGVVVNSLFAFRSPGHRFLRLALEIATARIERRDPGDDTWHANGPAIFTYMYYLFHAGSIGAFLEQFAEHEDRDYSAFLAELVGEHSRISHAFEGIRVLPFEEAKTWIVLGTPAPYKQTNTHWTNWQGSIFR